MPLDFDPLNFDPLERRSVRAKQAWRQPATPEATEGFSQSVKNMGLTGLGYGLSVLDKPRRALAGVLAGKPREALAALPFSDTLGLTDPAQSTSGAELNKKYLGIKDDNSWKSWGLGMANELALDPLNLVSFGAKGALTAAGKTAHAGGLTKGLTRHQMTRGFDAAHDAMLAAGRTPDEIAHFARQGNTVSPAGSGIDAGVPLTGMMRIGVPLTQKGVTVGTGKVGQHVARAQDILGDFVKYKVPGMKAAASLFDSSVGRATSEEGQKGFRAYGTPTKAAEESTGRGQQFRTIDLVNRLVNEGTSPGAAPPPSVAPVAPAPIAPPPSVAPVAAPPVAKTSVPLSGLAKQSVAGKAKKNKKSERVGASGLTREELQEIMDRQMASILDRYGSEYYKKHGLPVPEDVLEHEAKKAAKAAVQAAPPQPPTASPVAPPSPAAPPSVPGVAKQPMAGNVAPPATLGVAPTPQQILKYAQQARYQNLKAGKPLTHLLDVHDIAAAQHGPGFGPMINSTLKDLRAEGKLRLERASDNRDLTDKMYASGIPSEGGDFHWIMPPETNRFGNLAPGRGNPDRLNAAEMLKYERNAGIRGSGKTGSSASAAASTKRLPPLPPSMVSGLPPAPPASVASSAVPPGSPRWTADDVQDALRMHAEGQSPSTVLPVNPDLWARVQAEAGELRQFSPGHLASRQEAGVPQTRYRDEFGVEHFPRKGAKVNHPNSPQMGGGNLYSTVGGSMIKRQNIYRNTPGGTAMWNRWSTNSDLAGGTRVLDDTAVAERVLSDMVTHAQQSGIQLTADHVETLADKSIQIARRLAKHEPSTGPIFARDIVSDVSRSAASQSRMMAAAKGSVGTIGDMARRRAPGMVPIGRLVGGKQGLKLKTFADEQGIRGGLVELHKALAKQGMAPTEPLIEKIHQKLQADLAQAVNAADPAKARSLAIQAAQKTLKRHVNRYGVTAKQAEDLLADYGRWKGMPKEVSNIVTKVVDPVTQTFRNAAYSVWLPSHVRNLMGGAVQTLGQGGLSPGSQALAYAIRNGTARAADIAKFLPNMPRGLTDEQARKFAHEMGFTHAKIGSGINAHETLAPSEQGQHALPGSEQPVTPGEYAKGLGQTAWQAAKGLANPRNIIDPRRWPQAFAPGGTLEQVGVGQGAKNFPWLEVNRRLGTDVENQLRMAQFLHHSKQGMALPVAGEKTLATQFDYNTLADFEKHVMRRAIPFYTFMRRNLPLQLQTLATNPGRISSQLRLTAPKGQDYIPEHLASGVAIPVGDEYQNAEGNTARQYVSQLGIPIEEAFERFKMHPNDIGGSLRDTALAYMGALNPLIKGPLEAIFDKQFFSGRNLSDLKPQGAVGGISKWLDPEQQHPFLRQVASQSLANSPATRFVTAADKLLDPRKSALQKAVNLLTGVRVTDVDVEKTKAIETRRVLESILKLAPQISQHTETYVRPEDAKSLTPDLIQKLQILSRLQANAQKAAREKRQREMQAQQMP